MSLNNKSIFISACICGLLLINTFTLEAKEANQDKVKSKVKSKVKNVILIIGDGMGPGQIALLEAYSRQAVNPQTSRKMTAFSRILKEGGSLGVSMTHAANVLTTDSAASASQLATGKASNPETLGADEQGNTSISVLTLAKQMGKATGLVSDVRISHSTPAAFVAHQPHRTLENAITIDVLANGADVMLSGGLRHWIPKSANDENSELHKKLLQMTDGAVEIKSKREDQLNLLQQAHEKGYQLTFTRQQLDKIKPTTSPNKVLGLFASGGFPDAIITDRDRDNKQRTLPSLTEMSAKALELLDQNEKGFFLMIESGLIDWAAHNNDTGTLLHEMLKIDETLHFVLDWIKDRDDTLLIVTADHETGGFGFSYSSDNIPEPKDLSGDVFKDGPYKTSFNYGKPVILDKIYNQKLSYVEIFNDTFDQLPIEQQTAKKLMEIVNQASDFDITEKQAARILAKEDNPYYIEGHRSLYNKEVPKLLVNDAFFPYSDDNRKNLLAMEISTQQSVVWSNGTHTSTPVLVFATGDKLLQSEFVQFMEHTTLGQKLISIIEAR